MSIYVWTLGEFALARVCKRVYAKVRIAKDENGLFHDEKVLAITPNSDGSINVTKQLCYYVEICRSNEGIWLPYTCLRLAERSRPFYGPADKAPPPEKKNTVVRKRKIKEDHTLPLGVPDQTSLKSQDFNITYDLRHLPMKVGKYENAFKEFLRRGKDMVFDEFFFKVKEDSLRLDDLDYLLNVDASTEDKFELVIKDIMTEKEVKHYLKQCWRYNTVNREAKLQYDRHSDGSRPTPSNPGAQVHTSWCVVCGEGPSPSSPAAPALCPLCPAACHYKCREQWLYDIMHRKNPPKEIKEQLAYIDKKVLSSTRTKRIVKEEVLRACPSCEWGPGVGYGDVVWHKLGPCPWWPAKVLTPGSVPSCLLSRKHGVHDWPVQYYGTLNYAWGTTSRMCLFMPRHANHIKTNSEQLRKAILDACDDYIAVYLT